VFHSLHEGQRPIHFGDCAPQFWQKKDVLVFVLDMKNEDKDFWNGFFRSGTAALLFANIPAFRFKPRICHPGIAEGARALRYNRG
jgi:hypothetical protein